jgi:acetyltransferase-like isoleucine patch superfamily enzyme
MTSSKSVLLQLKFIIVFILNKSGGFVPLPLRKYYYKLFAIKIGRGSVIHRGIFFFHIGNIEIGNNSTVNFNCYLDNRRRIIIGNNVGIAHNCKIYTLGHNLDDPFFETKGGMVIIEDNAFIFSNALIMPNVTIGEGAIVLSGSVVTKSVDSYTIVGGNPAQFVKKRIKDIRYTQKYGFLYAL